MNLTDKEKIFLRAIVEMHPVEVDSFDDEDPDDFDEEDEEEEEEGEIEPVPEGLVCTLMVGYVFSTKWVMTVAALTRLKLIEVFERPVWEGGERRRVMFAVPTPKGWEVGQRLLEERDAPQRNEGTPTPGKFWKIPKQEKAEEDRRPKCPACARPLTARPDLGANHVVCYNPKCQQVVNSNKPDLRSGPIEVNS